LPHVAERQYYSNMGSTSCGETAQRNHDALNAAGRALLASGKLGQHNGLPATIIMSTTLRELQAGAGRGLTGGGTLLPMSDVIRLACHAHHYLCIFDHGEALALRCTPTPSIRNNSWRRPARDGQQPGDTLLGYAVGMDGRLPSHGGQGSDGSRQERLLRSERQPGVFHQPR
jgi:Domain of unknown function (DUF222)